MQADPSIFKAYDIRGIYPRQIDGDGAYAIGRAYAILLCQLAQPSSLRVAVGGDMRLSTPELKTRLIEGLLDGGLHVDDIGLVSTPTFYFGVASYGYDGGIQVSASHNPKEWNGFKMVREHAIPISMETGIREIHDMVTSQSVPNIDSAILRGTLSVVENILQDQVESQMKETSITTTIKPFKIAIDTANGMGAPEMKELFSKLP